MLCSAFLTLCNDYVSEKRFSQVVNCATIAVSFNNIHLNTKQHSQLKTIHIATEALFFNIPLQSFMPHSTCIVQHTSDCCIFVAYSKTSVKRTLSKRLKIGFQDQLSLNADQKYCRMLQGEHSAILLNFIKLPFVITIFCFLYF